MNVRKLLPAYVAIGISLISLIVSILVYRHQTTMPRLTVSGSCELAVDATIPGRDPSPDAFGEDYPRPEANDTTIWAAVQNITSLVITNSGRGAARNVRLSITGIADPRPELTCSPPKQVQIAKQESTLCLQIPVIGPGECLVLQVTDWHDETIDVNPLLCPLLERPQGRDEEAG